MGSPQYTISHIDKIFLVAFSWGEGEGIYVCHMIDRVRINNIFKPDDQGLKVVQIVERP